MSRFLFVSLPLTGHLDWGGVLATAAELARRNHAVAWTSEPALAAAVTAAGLPFLPLTASGWRPLPPLPAGLSPAQMQKQRRQRALDAWLHPGVVAQAAAELRALIANWQPDLVVAEPYAAAAALAAEAAGRPLALCGRPALPDPQKPRPNAASQRVRHLCRQAGVAGRNWDAARGQIRSPLLHVDFFSRRWYADLPAVAPQTRFVGGQAGVTVPPATGEPPTVLITLGSLFRHDPAFFTIAAEAVLQAGGHPLVVTGRQEDSTETAALSAILPAGVTVRSWVDFSATLPRMAAIIHHGGVGTTHAALRHGLPQIVTPHAGDQRPQAGRVTQAKVGYGVQPADFDRNAADWLVRQVLSEQTLRANARAWRDELAQLGGVSAAAAALEASLDPAGRAHQDA